MRLNPSKTEIVILSPRDSDIKDSFHLVADCDPLPVAPSARNLGVYFDSKLNFDEHVTRVVRACNATLVNLWRIGGKLSKKLRTTLVSSLVHSKLDYCNSLLVGVTKKNLDRLQKVQNAAARFVFGQKKWRGATNLRKALHFLPVAERIEFKICVLVYKCVNGLAPGYLSDRIQRRRRKSMSLRKDDDNLLLETPRTKYMLSEKAFSICGPRFWNRLPRGLRYTESLNCFKRDLKTHLFGRAYT